MIQNAGKYLGRFLNEWRRRDVAVYEHVDNPELLITVGWPMDGGEAVVCEERRSDWISTLKSIEDATAQGEIYIYN